jgi:hypothetical protein
MFEVWGKCLKLSWRCENEVESGWYLSNLIRMQIRSNIRSDTSAPSQMWWQRSQTRAPRTIALLCWILGVSDDSFQVKIDDDRRVVDLKEAILKKRPIGNVHADQLELWQVSGIFLLSQICTHTYLARCLSLILSRISFNSPT